MTTFGAIAGAIEADLGEITDIGVTLDSAPLPPLDEDWATFVDTFMATVGGQLQVRAWTVGFAGSRAVQQTRGFGSQKVLRDVKFVVRGYLGRLHPSSEGTFRDLCEAVLRKLDADPGLRGTVIEHTPVEVDLPDNADGILLGDVVCHYVEISLTARVEMTLSES